MLPVISVLVLTTVILAGNSLRRNGRWSTETYRAVVVIVTVLTMADLALAWWNAHR
jgi:hypothetical protein